MMQESYDEQRAIIAARQESVQRAFARTSLAFYILRLELQRTQRVMDKACENFARLSAHARSLVKR